MSLIVGIDLGTTFSAAARIDETGRPVMIETNSGKCIIPSVVKYEGPSKTIVGASAEKQMDLEPNVIARFKRDMGTSVSYKHQWGDTNPQQLSTLVLRKIKADVEQAVGQPISEAVVTIPANFSNEARESTLAAAQSAGITVKHIINEPTAAAMYFAHQSGQSLAGNYVVFDLGGGTFDVTVIRVNGQQIDVLATEGISKLGGDDFDRAIAEIAAKKYKEQRTVDLKTPQLRQDNDYSKTPDIDYRRTEAEELKIILSESSRTTARPRGDGGRADIPIEQREFEEAISTLMAQIELLCESVIEEADISVSDIADVILAGGSTRIPIVQKTVERVFGKKPVTFGNPDETIALGAALYAAYKTDSSNLNPVQKQAVSTIELAEIAPKYFGIVSVGFNTKQGVDQLQNSIVLRKGDKLPASKTEMFYTVQPGQTAVDCTATESNSPESDLRFVKPIWKGELGPLPADRPEGQPIEVTFSYDTNGIMNIVFKDVESGEKTDVELSMEIKKEADNFDIERFTVA